MNIHVGSAKDVNHQLDKKGTKSLLYQVFLNELRAADSKESGGGMVSYSFGKESLA